MKVDRFDRLLASTALGVALMVYGHPAFAQQPADQVQIVVPLPEELPPPTAKDFGVAPAEMPAAAPAGNAAVAPAPEAATPVEAAAPVVQPAPAPALTAAAPASAPTVNTDSAVSDKLREMIAGKSLDRLLGRKSERAGAEAFYKARDFKPLWIANGAIDARAKSAMAYLAKADEVGLDPSDYLAPDFAAATTPDALAAAELALTASALTFAREAQIGRIHFTRVSADIAFTQVAPEPADILARLAASDDSAGILDSYNPPLPEFKALRAKLAELRQGKAAVTKLADEKPEPTIRIASGPIMRPGVKDERVVALRKRLKIGDTENRLYNEDVVEAVKTFQTEADLDTDGNVGPNTLAALNGEKKAVSGPSADPIDMIVVNMERWRWYARNLGNPHVIVNIPNYTLALWNDDKVYWQTKIVVGKPGKDTPLISAEMKFITVNPTWNVPPSIIEKEYLPALQQDPQALDRIGLKLTQDADGTVHIAQPPGAGNALGRIRFNFPNKFLVYQHDTPDKHLFKRDERAFSHGCMRVMNPLTYGEKILSLVLPKENYTEARLEKMFGGSEININFPKNIWVHLTYQTAFVDDDGKLQLRKDVYGWDQRMIQILKGSERKVADIAIERAPNSSSKPVRMPVGMYGGGSSYGGPSGPNFFDWLFNGGGNRQQVQEPAYRPRGAVGPRYSRDGRIVTR